MRQVESLQGKSVHSLSKSNGVAFSCTGAFCTAGWKFFQGELWVHTELTSVVPSLKKTNKTKNEWRRRILLLSGQDWYRPWTLCGHTSGLGWRAAGRGKQGRKAGLPRRAYWERVKTGFLIRLFCRLNFTSPKTLPLKGTKHSQDPGPKVKKRKPYQIRTLSEAVFPAISSVSLCRERKANKQ